MEIEHSPPRPWIQVIRRSLLPAEQAEEVSVQEELYEDIGGGPRCRKWIPEQSTVTLQVFRTAWQEKIGLRAQKASKHDYYEVTWKEMNEKYSKMIRDICLLRSSEKTHFT